MKVADIVAAVEEFAPLGIQEQWDNSGLCIGSPQDPVRGVMVGFDCTPQLVDEAAAKGCDMVITHHPLIFKGLKQINSEEPTGEAIVKAIRAGIAVYAAHTTADKVIEGVSGAMARRLGLQDISILEDEGGTGLGAVGTLEKPLTGMEAIALIKERFGLKIVRTSTPIECPITRVAVLGGSGGSEIPAARAAGAQLYITADISYHNFFTPEGFMVADIGHFESEVEITDILFSFLKKKFPNFAVHLGSSLREGNPVHWF
ncbi:MAG: Nif3-like dinuclear metal center hexameric protein [Bacteroidales bacterium]|nr:Nif3-like dinuclear metal center hexameric protein [Bacteroidales bacterium]